MEFQILLNVLQAFGGFDPEILDHGFFKDCVLEDENTCEVSDDTVGIEPLEIQLSFPWGQEGEENPDKKISLNLGGISSNSSMAVNDHITTMNKRGHLRPSSEAVDFFDQDFMNDCFAVDALLRELQGDRATDKYLPSNDVAMQALAGLVFDENQVGEDNCDVSLIDISGAEERQGAGETNKNKLKPNIKDDRVLMLIDTLVRIALSYAKAHGPVDQEDFKEFYYHIDFLKFSMFNVVSEDDLAGFKFLAGMTGYDEFDREMKRLGL